MDEPPPWLDEVPFDDEPAMGAAIVPVAPVTPDAALVSMARPTARPASAATPPPPVSAATPRSMPAVQRTPLGERWESLVQQLQTDGALVALVRELAMQGELVDIESTGEQSLWRLIVERDSLRTTALIDKLQAAVQLREGPGVRLEASPGVAQDSPARREAELALQRQQQAERIILEDRQVRALMAQFATARVVPGSIKPAAP
jgi:DNA polymerase-3 subunit gamma/tau